MNSNSFATNSAGGPERLFPLRFTLRQPAPDVWVAHLHAQALNEVVDLIVRNAQPSLCIFEVGHTATDPVSGDLLSLSEVAHAAGIAPTELDVDTLLIKTVELPALLRGLPHYNLWLLGLPGSTSADDAYEAVVTAVGEAYVQGKLVLDKVPQSTLYMDSHDDCFLYIEARSRTQLLDHFVHLLREFVAAQLNLAAGQIAPPAHSLLEELLGSSGSCTMFDTHSKVTDGRLRLGYSAVEYRLGDGPVEPHAYVTYDPIRAEWSAG